MNLKEEGWKMNESYDEIKDTLNKLHDKLYSTDDTLKKRFIDNPDKEKLAHKDLLKIISSLSKLEAQVVIAKDALVQELIRQNLNSVK
jgi:hypothetical protein